MNLDPSLTTSLSPQVQKQLFSKAGKSTLASSLLPFVLSLAFLLSQTIQQTCLQPHEIFNQVESQCWDCYSPDKREKQYCVNLQFTPMTVSSQNLKGFEVEQYNFKIDLVFPALIQDLSEYDQINPKKLPVEFKRRILNLVQVKIQNKTESQTTFKTDFAIYKNKISILITLFESLQSQFNKPMNEAVNPIEIKFLNSILDLSTPLAAGSSVKQSEQKGFFKLYSKKYTQSGLNSIQSLQEEVDAYFAQLRVSQIINHEKYEAKSIARDSSAGKDLAFILNDFVTTFGILVIFLSLMGGTFSFHMFQIFYVPEIISKLFYLNIEYTAGFSTFLKTLNGLDGYLDFKNWGDPVDKRIQFNRSFKSPYYEAETNLTIYNQMPFFVILFILLDLFNKAQKAFSAFGTKKIENKMYILSKKAAQSDKKLKRYYQLFIKKEENKIYFQRNVNMIENVFMMFLLSFATDLLFASTRNLVHVEGSLIFTEMHICWTFFLSFYINFTVILRVCEQFQAGLSIKKSEKKISRLTLLQQSMLNAKGVSFYRKQKIQEINQVGDQMRKAHQTNAGIQNSVSTLNNQSAQRNAFLEKQMNQIEFKQGQIQGQLRKVKIANLLIKDNANETSIQQSAVVRFLPGLILCWISLFVFPLSTLFHFNNGAVILIIIMQTLIFAPQIYAVIRYRYPKKWLLFIAEKTTNLLVLLVIVFLQFSNDFCIILTMLAVGVQVLLSVYYIVVSIWLLYKSQKSKREARAKKRSQVGSVDVVGGMEVEYTEDVLIELKQKRKSLKDQKQSKDIEHPLKQNSKRLSQEQKITHLNNSEKRDSKRQVNQIILPSQKFNSIGSINYESTALNDSNVNLLKHQSSLGQRPRQPIKQSSDLRMGVLKNRYKKYRNSDALASEFNFNVEGSRRGLNEQD